MATLSLNQSLANAVIRNDYRTVQKLIESGAEANAITKKDVFDDDNMAKIQLEKIQSRLPFFDYRLLTLLFKNRLRIPPDFYAASPFYLVPRCPTLFALRTVEVQALITEERDPRNQVIKNSFEMMFKNIVQLIIMYDESHSIVISEEENNININSKWSDGVGRRVLDLLWERLRIFDEEQTCDIVFIDRVVRVISDYASY